MTKHKQTYRKALPADADRRDLDNFTCSRCETTTTTAQLALDCQAQLMLASELLTHCLTERECPWCALDYATPF
jgi:hypothetical protein